MKQVVYLMYNVRIKGRRTYYYTAKLRHKTEIVTICRLCLNCSSFVFLKKGRL
jgi:hypothetical protein